MTPAEVYNSMVDLIFEGKNIDAMKIARQNFGMTLKESKDLVEAIVDSLFREKK